MTIAIRAVFVGSLLSAAAMAVSAQAPLPVPGQPAQPGAQGGGRGGGRGQAQPSNLPDKPVVSPLATI
jgi:hypothetical protein